ncbi:MAG: site-specific integrase [Chloroflexota bacterium]
MAKSSHRSPGEGSIYQTTDGRWRGAITISGRGTQTRRVVSGRSRAEVAAKLDVARRNSASGVYAGRQTVGDYLARWLQAEKQRVRASTWQERESHTRLYIVPAMGRVPLARLTPLDVESMTAALVARGLSPRTAAHCRVSLRRALGDAQRDGLVARNVAALARPPRIPSRGLEAGRDYLDATDLRRLLSAAKVHPLGPLFTLAATTGLRQGELLGLSWGDVDAERRTLTVRRSLARAHGGGWALAEPKTARSRRTIHLPSAAVAALERHRDLQNVAHVAAGGAWQNVDQLAFTDTIGRPLGGSYVSHAFHRLLDAAGLPSIPFHGLRHSAASALLAQGVPLIEVSRMLGHSTISITADTYSGVTPERMRDAADAMDRALGGAS